MTAAEDDGTVELWDAQRLDGCEVIPSLPPDVRAVALSPDGRVATSHLGQVCLLDRENGSIERKLHVPAGAKAVAFSPDGRIVAAACSDK